MDGFTSTSKIGLHHEDEFSAIKQKFGLNQNENIKEISLTDDFFADASVNLL
jgi:hypothetical protein